MCGIFFILSTKINNKHIKKNWFISKRKKRFDIFFCIFIIEIKSLRFFFHMMWAFSCCHLLRYSMGFDSQNWDCPSSLSLMPVSKMKNQNHSLPMMIHSFPFIMTPLYLLHDINTFHLSTAIHQTSPHPKTQGSTIFKLPHTAYQVHHWG